MKINDLSLYKLGFLVVFISSFFLARDAFAGGSAGFEIAANSTGSLAKGNAVVAAPQDSSTVAFNPAGLSELDRPQVSLGTSLLGAAVGFDRASNGNHEDASEMISPVPYLYFSTPTPIENFYIGGGVNAMFGLVTKYDSQGSFKYTGFHNELKTRAHHLSGAYKFSDEWSVGAGFTYMQTTLKQVGKFNISTIAGVAGLGDGDFEFDVAGEGYGWNAGILYTPNQKHSIGLFYRSTIRTQLEGKISSDNMGALAGIFGGANTETSATTDITFPANITLGYQYKFNDKLAIEADLGWTSWSDFEAQDITFGNPNAVLLAFGHINRDFVDTWAVATGFDYKLNDKFNLLGGYYFYQMAANEANYNADIPDGNRHAFSIGTMYDFNNNVELNLTYMYTFTEEQSISNTVGNSNGGDIDGDYNFSVHIISVGLTYKF